jgi:hypothetical protein
MRTCSWIVGVLRSPWGAGTTARSPVEEATTWTAFARGKVRSKTPVAAISSVAIRHSSIARTARLR